MRRTHAGPLFSATDLSHFFECEHRLGLELSVSAGLLKRPGQNELDRELLERRGREHEAHVLDWYRAQDKEVQSPHGDGGAASATEELMRRGVDVIYQGTLAGEGWSGRPDFLVRVPGESRFGTFKYEPADAKLARETKGRAVLQLCVYADLLEAVQGAPPDFLRLLPGAQPIAEVPLPWSHFSAYYRRIRGALLAFAGRDDAGAVAYPEPCEHCDVCPWWKRCDDRRHEDDHTSLVAGTTRQQRDRLAEAGILTLSALARLKADARVAGIRSEALTRLEEQAAVQLEGRGMTEVLHRRHPVAGEPTGVALLPASSSGDLFLDLEGDAYFQGEGLEYLFGLLELGSIDDYFGASEASPERYSAFWASTRLEEKRAFEGAIDAIVRRRQEFPTAHVYHFGHRENTAFKRLASRHGTRIDELDTLLREEVFVDLHRITRQAIRAAVETYSLKALEGLAGYGFVRGTNVRDAARAMQHFGWWLETGEAHVSPAELRTTIERYNEDDCRSTRALRDWLLAQKEALLREQRFKLDSRPAKQEQKPSTKGEDERRETAALVAALQAGLPESPEEDESEQAAKRLLAHLLDWHRRELNPAYWEYFRARDLPEEERLEDRAVVGQLRFVRSEPYGGARSRSDRYVYEFPNQEHGLRLGDDAHDPRTSRKAGEVLAVGTDHVHLKRARNTEEHPSALMPPPPIDTARQRASLRALARQVLDHGLGAPGPFQAARDLLLRRPRVPGLAAGASLASPNEDSTAALGRLALALDGSWLAVQGPPGSGKTTAAATMIVELVRAGRRVGIAANSHQVIVNLLLRARAQAAAARLPMRAVHMAEEDKLDAASLGLELDNDDERVARRLGAKELDVVGGTAWKWARENLRECVDVLVVDEAGQVSLANALAMAQAARNVVLLGDPNQLEQPQKGVHPEGSGVSALEHLLGGHRTLPENLGLFMPHTWRLHPALCAFTSEVFYDGRLTADPSLARQHVTGAGPLGGSGLRFVPVEHRGSTNHAPAEIERIAALLDELFTGCPRFTDRHGNERDLRPEDVLIVAPYNVQVAELKKRLPRHRERIGTVDKFQGQEAPIVVYSMTTSSAEDAPRGMEFLFSLNRLNVATSRAQAVVAVVASPTLALARCRVPRQMQLANAFCAYLERAGA
ncbi:MAG TPA: TM0106 family RecB-like putative nuclease [Polyangiaceae bacterium]|nr:TM0106 family RecB-like putative nuclease [Polyangiaceae bacterium]